VKKILILITLIIFCFMSNAHAGTINSGVYSVMSPTSYRNNYNLQVQRNVMQLPIVQHNYNVGKVEYRNYSNYSNFNNSVNQFNYSVRMNRGRH
jgi:uncharacterized protein YxeA